jgi:hypothetical protein
LRLVEIAIPKPPSQTRHSAAPRQRPAPTLSVTRSTEHGLQILNPKFQLDQLTTACVALCREHEGADTLVLRQARLNMADRAARGRPFRPG